MKWIGITGGVGAGKSAVLDYIRENYCAKVYLADEIAHDLMKPGTNCYKAIRETFQDASLCMENGEFDKEKLSRFLFGDSKNRERLNAIVHPAVKQEVIRLVEIEKKKAEIDYFILEAALLLEEEYDKLCDEIWYIYTSEENRRQRLKDNRGYSDEKIDAIFRSQLSEECYRSKAKWSIDNNDSIEKTKEQIDMIFNQR